MQYPRCLNTLPIAALLWATSAVAAEPASQPSLVIDRAAHPDLQDARQQIPTLVLDIKYATTDNFTGQNLYGSFRSCLLREATVAKLAEADRLLRQRHPDLRLLIHDCLRPRSVQLKMWQVVEGTAQQSYVANPHSRTGSLHNYGAAVDLSLASKDGTPLDMGTPFDHLGPAAQPRHEFKRLARGELSAAQLANRLILREVMIRAGFKPIASEWWHFNAYGPREVRRRYKIVE